MSKKKIIKVPIMESSNGHVVNLKLINLKILLITLITL